MAEKNSNIGLPAHFSGIVRLFPLPNLVVYPGVVQALHIFEPRYRQMTEDAMAADQLIAMSLYQSPAEAMDPGKSSEIYDTICICKVIANQKLDDGKYNLIVVGVRRARIVRELATEQPYRMAEVQIINEDLSVTFGRIKELRQQLLEVCREINLFEKMTQNQDVRRIISNDLALGLLVDLIAFLSQLDCQQRQAVLELANVEARCLQLINFLRVEQSEPQSSSDFPPNFSDN